MRLTLSIPLMLNPMGAIAGFGGLGVDSLLRRGMPIGTSGRNRPVTRFDRDVSKAQEVAKSERPSGGFSAEQHDYLTDALSRMVLHRLFSGSAGGKAAPVAAPAVHVTQFEDLCNEELARLELHPLDVMARLEAWTDATRMATGLD